MKLKIFKPAIAVMIALLAAGSPVFAQTDVRPDSATTPALAPLAPIVPDDAVVAPVTVKLSAKDKKELKAQLRELKTTLKNLSVTTNESVTAALANVSTDVNVQLADIAPKINMALKGINVDANYNDDGKQEGIEKVKNFTKSYNINASDALAIENRYGKVVVNTWDKNEFKVEVEIKAEANSDDEAKKMLDRVSISDSKEGSTVSFKTNFGSEDSFWSSFHGGKRSVHKLEINYTVYMPAKNNLNIDNRYGATVLPDMSGKVVIYSSYGSFFAKSLTNQNKISVNYGSAEMGNSGPLDLEVGYGSLKMGNADRLDANISYSSADIGKIRNSGNINLKYSGGLKIADLDRDLKNLTIHSSYSNVEIGLSGDENANFDITTHYGEFDYGSHNVTVTSKSPSDDDRGPHFTYNYKGHLGRGGSDKNITVSTSYGNVTFE